MHFSRSKIKLKQIVEICDNSFKKGGAVLITKCVSANLSQTIFTLVTNLMNICTYVIKIWAKLKSKYNLNKVLIRAPPSVLLQIHPNQQIVQLQY